jgi:hypothetical protein
MEAKYDLIAWIRGRTYLETCKVLAVGVLVKVVFELFDVLWFLEEQ